MTGSDNIDSNTVRGFGEEWSRYDQTALEPGEHRAMFDAYFSIFPLRTLSSAQGIDLGCGSGRWSKLLAPQVGRLHCVEPAAAALEVARRNLAGLSNVEFHAASANTLPFAAASQDFACCLGVLHHVPDPRAGLEALARVLKPGAPLLLYLYYALDDRPGWYRALWSLSDTIRRRICRLPARSKAALTTAIAALVYWPLARVSRFAGPNFPLHSYARLSFYTMRTDALDRFGTPIEHRFSRPAIEAMLRDAGFERLTFSPGMPKWVVLGWRAGSA